LADGDAAESFAELLQQHGVRAQALGRAESGGIRLVHMNVDAVTGLERALAPGEATREPG
jgi:hypothetical protein